LPRLAEVNVQIDEARRDNQPATIDFIKSLALGNATGDAPIDDGEIAGLIPFIGGIDDAAVPEEKGGHYALGFREAAPAQR
jgi:hypothetical protein